MATTKTPKLKIGTKVLVKRRRMKSNGVETYWAPGRIAGSDTLANGLWYSVKLSKPGDNAVLINVRASQVEVAI